MRIALVVVTAGLIVASTGGLVLAAHAQTASPALPGSTASDTTNARPSLAPIGGSASAALSGATASDAAVTGAPSRHDGHVVLSENIDLPATRDDAPSPAAMPKPTAGDP